eukprot:g28607.t1
MKEASLSPDRCGRQSKYRPAWETSPGGRSWAGRQHKEAARPRVLKTGGPFSLLTNQNKHCRVSMIANNKTLYDFKKESDKALGLKGSKDMG